MEHSNRPIRGFVPVYDNEGEYTVVKSKVAKEELYLEGLKKSQTPEQPAAPAYDAAKIAAIIQEFLSC